MTNPPPTPRWVKVFVIIVIVVAVLVVVVLVTGVGGEHGPRRHAPSGDADGSSPPIEQKVQLDGPVSHTPPIDHWGNRHGHDT
jgi:hypothetical protein